MKTHRLTMLSSVCVALAVWVGACASQPPPPCPVATGSPLGVPAGNSPLGDSAIQFALPNWWFGYTPVSGTGACAGLGGEEIGLQRYEQPGKSELTLAMRSFNMGYLKGNADGYGSLDYVDDELVVREDPMDPMAKKMSAIGKLTAFPNADHICEVTDVVAADQSWDEQVFPYTSTTMASTVDQGGNGVVDEDAGTVTFPARHLRYEWKDIKIVSTSEVPGQVLTGKLTINDDACTATYDVKGIWPITLCGTDLDCHPYPLPDAGDSDITIAGRRFAGSGLNPALETTEKPFKCNLSQPVKDFTAVYGVGEWGVCETQRTVAELTGAK